MLRVSDLRHKDVVNNIDGKRLGFIKDIELDLNEGRIKSIILPGENKMFSFWGHNDDLVIDWQNVKKIGLDVILVDVETVSNIKSRQAFYKEDENGYYERKKKRRKNHDEDEYDYYQPQEMLTINEDKKRHHKFSDEEYDYRSDEEKFPRNNKVNNNRKIDNEVYDYSKPQEDFSVDDERNTSSKRIYQKPDIDDNPFKSYPKEKLNSYDISKIKDWGEPTPWKKDLNEDKKDNNPWSKSNIKKT